MVTLTFVCSAGTHVIGVETVDYADSNGVSSTVNVEHATSVGREDGYVTRAQVFVKATTEDQGVLAYSSDGRVHMHNRQQLGVPAPAMQVQLDSISDNPGVSRTVNCGCSTTPTSTVTSACLYTSAAGDSGDVALDIGHGVATAQLIAKVVRPASISLQLDDATLTSISCGGAAAAYQTTQTRVFVDGLDMTQMVPSNGFSSSDTSVATVDATGRVSGVASGTASVYVSGLSSHGVSVTVSDTFVQPTLVPRIVTALTRLDATQVFNDEGDVGYMYVLANYSNGDVHDVYSSELNVTIRAAQTVTYSLSGATTT
jgi:hypothetical protein